MVLDDRMRQDSSFLGLLLGILLDGVEEGEYSG
jgi:hypothetical protein